MPASDLVARPERGRRFTAAARVRLSDVSIVGRLRLDSIARMLQDVSSDDTADAAYADEVAWVVRWLVIELDPEARMPRLYDDVSLVTWCSGTGPRWAERRTDIGNAGTVVVRAAALWVFVDAATGRPIPLGDGFDAVYGEAAGGRRVGQRLRHDPPPEGAPGRPWPVRFTDFDVLGHVTNAAYWFPVEETLSELAPESRVTRAELEFRAGIDPGDAVEMITVLNDDGRSDRDTARELHLWLTVPGESGGSEVRASAVVTLAPGGGSGRRF